MTRPLRLLFVSEEGLHGAEVMGAAGAELALRTGLSGRDDVEARIARLAPPGAFARLLQRQVPGLGHLDLDLQPLRWHVVNGARAAALVRRELAADDVDAVHVNSHAISFLLVAEMRRRPFFVSADATAWVWHRMGVSRRPRAYSRVTFAPSVVLERRALTAARRVLAWTEWAADLLRQTARRANVVVWNPGIDLERFAPGPRERRTLARILFVGGRFAAKGGVELLEALEPLLGRDAELDVVTPAYLPPRAAVRVHRLSPGDPRLAELYRQADIFCLPTHADTMGWAIIEAMASGTPVVATPVGAIPELVEGGCGVLVEPRDVVGLRRAIEALLDDDERRRAMGDRGRTRCEERYDARTQTAKLIELVRGEVG